MSGRPTILFLCVVNSARSQMAEGLARTIAGDRVRVLSARSEANRVNPHAVAVLSELSIDASRQRSKAVSELSNESIDVVITVISCGSASTVFCASATGERSNYARAASIN